MPELSTAYIRGVLRKRARVDRGKGGVDAIVDGDGLVGSGCGGGVVIVGGGVVVRVVHVAPTPTFMLTLYKVGY